ncbi:hypothetical protein HNV10_09605 [Winogradskyella litoriviva]|uniref:Na+-translocating membrane potential-generating system MpsC domain-containing protein n=1 Tax=Winogradskyella litoriviva TaxID=1220182 RepID=A0ABX2E6S4_9FLAO|nr:hypothetical protein [Winogradskyella litoriviva]NRD23494.1 hypothetical protein [Winogradskyella litoriviva]
MTYQEDFIVFWQQVKQSIKEEAFAKLTMAKTIGKPELKNIFLRPIYADGEFKVILKYSFRPRETEDIEEEMTLEEALIIIKEHLKTSFLSVLLFSTAKDVTFKINKKGIGTITENYPTFKNVS